MFPAALLGAIIGSFLNVLILRTGTKEGLGGRSHCTCCRHQLQWFDLVPVLSWLFLSGRCRYCRARISIQYPLVELLTAALFAVLALAHEDIVLLLLSWGIAALFVAVAVYDLRTTFIPDEWNYGLAVLTFLYGYGSFGYENIVAFLSAGPFAAVPLFLLWAYSRGRWMGFGDVKLALSFGWLLGPVYGFVAVMFAFVIGAVVSIGILLPLPTLITFAQRYLIRSLSPRAARFTMQSEVPFGPFLIASVFILWFVTLFQIPVPMLEALL